MSSSSSPDRSVDRVARLKTNNFGLWMNTEQVEFNPFPTYLPRARQQSAARKITDDADARGATASCPRRRRAFRRMPQSLHVERFGAELVRLMTPEGLFGINEHGVKFLSPTAYVAQLTLPGDISNGLFITQTYLFKDGKLLAKRGDSFAVTRPASSASSSPRAAQHPLLYGLVCVLLAIGTGWLGGVIFKR